MGSGHQELTSEDIALRYLEQLPWPPYPFQEQAILTWFESSDGILVCAPTGTGKTVIAETALYEALLRGRRAYYTTPLIALTEQKYRELR
ncbi:MAG: DEAD/DEAH box helicase, partial [Planctomycetaceae bacterium]